MFPSGLAGAKKSSQKTEDILNNLTDEQRNALKELKTGPGFVIQPTINVESDNPVDIIVEFKQDPAKIAVIKAQAGKKRSTITLAEAKKQVEASHKKFKQAIQKTKGLQTDAQSEVITKEYKNAFNGVAMTIPGDKVKDLLQTGVVKRIWSDGKIQLSPIEMDTKNVKPKMMDSIPQINVDKLHDEGIEGKGIKVGVIDTGIDYNHPDLTEVYQGYRKTDGEDPSKVDPDSVMGWDFIDNDADPMERTYQEWQDTDYPEFDGNGSSYYTAHGTHVSGTIAGQKDNDVDGAVKGVAPAVDLYSYRVLGEYGSGSLNGVLAGIDKAVKEEMDVINLSLGTNGNDPLTPNAVAVNNATLSGVVTVIASGNAGPGAGTVGDPGSAALPITVGASDVSQTIPTFTATSGTLDLDDVQLLAKPFNDDLASYENKTFDVVFAGLGDKSDFTDLDVNGKIALIVRGDLAFDEKIKNAKSAGAMAVIVYNNEDGQIPSYVGENTAYVPSFRLSKADGEALKAIVEDGEPFTFGKLGNIQTDGDHLADFSSRGPVAGTYDIKPDVTAPGVAIYSTVPGYINDHENESYDIAYGRMNGTSMATPHVAGVAALILQANPDYNPFDVKAALMNTSVDMAEDYSVYEVGAGRIDAYRAVHADTFIKVMDQTEMIEGEEKVTIDNPRGSLVFGSHFVSGEKEIAESKNMAIENNTDTAKTYQLQAAFLQEKDGRQDAEANGVKLAIDNTIKVKAQDASELKAEMTIPKDAAFGTYEGYVRIQDADNAEANYQIPFAIRITDKGIDYVDLDRHAITNDWEFHPYLNPLIDMMFKLKSPMENVDIIVTDGETDEPVGYIGYMPGEDMAPDQEYYVMAAFTGNVNPFTDDPNHPISEEFVQLPEGGYNIKLIGTDKTGQQYTAKTYVVVDNTAPEVAFKDYKPGVIEVDESMYTDEDNYHALWIHTNAYDSTIDKLKEHGKAYDQSYNFFSYYESGNPLIGYLGGNEKGDIKFGVLPEEIADGPYELSLNAIDLATNLGDDIRYGFVKKGTQYSTATYKEDKVKLGDTLTFTLSLSNVKNLKNGSFDLKYLKDIYEFEDVQVNTKFAAYAEENGLDVKLDEPTFDDQEGKKDKTIHVGASVNGSDTGFSGNSPFIDVTFKVTGDAVYSSKTQLANGTVKQFNYETTDNKEVSIPVFALDDYQLVSKHSIVTGYVIADAFIHDGGFPITTDYEGMGVKVYAKSADGKVYNGTVDNHAEFEIKDLPVTADPYDIIVEVPGHLTSKSTIQVGKTVNGELVGKNFKINPPENKAGDVNGDGVIDIHDVMRVVAMYEKDDKKTDINQDGIVDETDIRYIEENFLKTEKGVTKKPTEKLGKKGLNDFLKALGLEPADNE